MGFRQLRTVLSENTGSYTNGVWVPGSRSVSTIQASIQPVVMGQDLHSLPEGRRDSDFVKVYTGTNLKIVDDAVGTQPDFIVYDGYCYEIVSRYANQNKLIPHFKFIAVKQVKYTSDADWLSGVTLRV